MEDLRIELNVEKERNRIFELRLNQLAMQFKNHVRA